MSANAHHFMEQLPMEQDTHTAPVVPFPRPTPETTANTPEQAEVELSKEQQMLNAFVAASKKWEGIDITTAGHEDSPKIAYTAHTFVRQLAEQFIERQTTAEKAGRLALKDTPEDDGLHDAPEAIAQEMAEDRAAPKWFLLPETSVNRRILTYYDKFGTHRRLKVDQKLRDDEKEYLEKYKKPTQAIQYVWVVNSEGGLEQQKQPRAVKYPEIGLAMQLEDILRQNDYQTAADSVEALLAAYGAWFLDRITGGDEGRPAANNIRRITDDDIPEDMQREKTRRK